MGAEGGGIGARLRSGREKLSLTVLQVAERMHTDPKIVESIEGENFEALGAPVYARGHIRHYAELVGESANELVALYSNVSKVGQPDLTRIVKAPTPESSNKLVAPALFVIAIFAVAGAIWWVSALSKKKPQLAETHVVGEEPAQSPGTPPPQAVPAVPNQPTESQRAPDRGPPAAMSMQPKPTRSAAIPPPAGTNAQPRSPAVSAPVVSANAPTRVASAAPTAPPQAPVPTAPRSKNQSQVTLHYSADSWTEVYDASGARLFYDVGAANSVQSVVGTPPLRVVLGNAAGVSVEFNGHKTSVDKLSQPDGSVQFFISRSGHVGRSKPVADGG